MIVSHLTTAGTLAFRWGAWSSSDTQILGAIIGGAIVIGLVGRWRERCRAERLERAAEAQGFSFARGHDAPLVAGLQNFHLFTRDGAGRTSNVMRGEADGVGYTLFDYRYVDGNGEHRSTCRQTVVVMEHEGWRLPRFHMEPVNFTTRLNRMMGSRRLDFESHPDFSRRYHLHGKDTFSMERLFTDELLDFCEAHPGISIEGSDTKLLFYYADSRMATDDLADWVERAWTLQQIVSDSHAAVAV